MSGWTDGWGPAIESRRRVELGWSVSRTAVDRRRARWATRRSRGLAVAGCAPAWDAEVPWQADVRKDNVHRQMGSLLGILDVLGHDQTVILVEAPGVELCESPFQNAGLHKSRRVRCRPVPLKAARSRTAWHPIGTSSTARRHLRWHGRRAGLRRGGPAAWSLRATFLKNDRGDGTPSASHHRAAVEDGGMSSNAMFPSVLTRRTRFTMSRSRSIASTARRMISSCSSRRSPPSWITTMPA